MKKVNSNSVNLSDDVSAWFNQEAEKKQIPVEQLVDIVLKDHMTFVALLKEGVDDLKSGRTIPHEEVFKNIL